MARNVIESDFRTSKMDPGSHFVKKKKQKKKKKTRRLCVLANIKLYHRNLWWLWRAIYRRADRRAGRRADWRVDMHILRIYVYIDLHNVLYMYVSWYRCVPS